MCVFVAVETLCLIDSPVKTFHSGPFDLSERRNAGGTYNINHGLILSRRAGSGALPLARCHHRWSHLCFRCFDKSKGEWREKAPLVLFHLFCFKAGVSFKTTFRKEASGITVDRTP